MLTVAVQKALVINGGTDCSENDVQSPAPPDANKTSRAWDSAAIGSVPKNVLYKPSTIRMLPTMLYGLCKRIYECVISLLWTKKEQTSPPPRQQDVILNDDQVLCTVFAGVFDRYRDLSASEVKTCIQEQPDKLKNIGTLYLENANLNRLPSEITLFTALADINLSKNKFNEIPSEVFSFAQTLTDLDISENKIHEIPSQIRVLKKLYALDISGNKIRTLPREIEDLTVLEVLHAEKNKLRELPDVFDSLKGLSKLYLEENELTTLPPSIGRSESLTEINCTGNKLREIPATIGDIRTLRFLNLSDNGISELVPLTGCERLAYLNMSRNKLKHVSPELFEGANLVTMSLAHNQIEELPALREDYLRPVLRTLDLSYNPFKVFPKTLCSMKVLTSLILDKDQIAAWHNELTELMKENPQLKVQEPVQQF